MVICRPHKRDQLRCAMSLVESGSTAEDAVTAAVGAWGKKYTRTTTPPSVADDLEAWLKKYKKLNDNLIATNGDPLFRYVRAFFIVCRSGRPRSTNDVAPPHHRLALIFCPLAWQREARCPSQH